MIQFLMETMLLSDVIRCHQGVIHMENAGDVFRTEKMMCSAIVQNVINLKWWGPEFPPLKLMNWYIDKHQNGTIPHPHQRFQASISGMLSIAPRDGMELRSAEGSTESKKTADHWESKSKENLPS